MVLCKVKKNDVIKNDAK